mmetsp:Transcript_43477/g.102697  ORF Transcript_43477/g.102697 Transcript_43477/m.102697 type:complete len:209 (-) Transcript_43477:455-1081(-)
MIDGSIFLGAGDAGVHDESALIQDSAQRHTHKHLPDGRIHFRILILGYDLVEKAIGAPHTEVLVVSAIEEDRVGVKDFEGEQDREHLDGVCATVNEVAVEEELVTRPRPACHFENQTEVEEPSVDVADDGELGFAREVDDVRLFAQNVSCCSQESQERLAAEPLVAFVHPIRHLLNEGLCDLLWQTDCSRFVNCLDAKGFIAPRLELA